MYIYSVYIYILCVYGAYIYIYIYIYHAWILWGWKRHPKKKRERVLWRILPKDNRWLEDDKKIIQRYEVLGCSWWFMDNSSCAIAPRLIFADVLHPILIWYAELIPPMPTKISTTTTLESRYHFLATKWIITMVHGSGQLIIFHQPEFPEITWNNGISLTKLNHLSGGNRSCEVDQVDNPTNFYPLWRDVQVPTPKCLDLNQGSHHWATPIKKPIWVNVSL